MSGLDAVAGGTIAAVPTREGRAAQAADSVAGAQARRPTMRFTRPVPVMAAVTVAGPAEQAGPLGGRFDRLLADHLVGQRTWEMAEAHFQEMAAEMAIAAAGLRRQDIDAVLGGDLQNQLGATGFAARIIDLPMLGLYGACATCGEGLLLGAALCDAGFCRHVLVVVSSHHHAAERQFRFPTEFGTQLPPTAQWTATGSVAVAVEAGARERALARLTAFTPGRVVDYRVKDPFHMGAAMAPAAADTLAVHLDALALPAPAYGAIYSGDLGGVGAPLCTDLLRAAGWDVPLRDCGRELYDPSHQDVHAGGSGAACSALVFAARILPALHSGTYRRACLCTTGALHSPTTYQQGESIPSVAHAVSLESPGSPGT